jgi:hypothetical protein
MKPFKFFFALSLGVILFLFFARFAIMAFIAAAFLSFGYFLVNKVKNFFKRMDWDDDRDAIHPYYRQRALAAWQEREEPLFGESQTRRERIERFRTIEIR